jgi:O-methyltransferase involved in polyketide biosynthesis
MNNKIKIELGEVQKTLLIPLVGRAKECEKPDPLVKDNYAREIVKNIDYDFDAAFANVPFQFTLNCVVRAHHLDTALVNVIEKHPDATIINIGAGLDTTYHRVDNGRIFWYDLDLSDSIELRRRLIPETDRNKFIAKSVFDTSWFKDIKVRRSKVFFISAGVLVYLKESEIRRLFLEMIHEFPDSEIMFEIYSKKLLWLRNHALARGQMKSELFRPMQWGVNSAKEIAKWSPNIKMLDEFPYYSRVTLENYWDEKTLTPIKIMNFFKVMKMVHLQFTN